MTDAPWFGHRDPPHIAAIKKRMAAPREPLAMTKAEAQLIGIQPGPLPSPPAIASTDARMIRWLTGVGEFDTNDPCDEWTLPGEGTDK